MSAMVMNFFGSPKGKKKAAVAIGADEASLDSVSLNDGVKSPGNDEGSAEMYKYPDKSERSLGESFQSIGGTSGITAKLLKEERQLQKIIAKSKDKPLDRKVQKATEKRREAILKEKVNAVTEMEQDVIIRCLGVGSDGYCLRHQDQKVRMGIVRPSFRFETISLCKSCAFGAASGIEVKNHGQKDKTISHAVNGALVATGVKKKKKKVKGSFAANMNGASPDKPRVDLNESFRSAHGYDVSVSENQFASSDGLQGIGENSGTPNHTSAHSRTDLEQDARWMQEVQVRVLQVNSWDNSIVPLKCHPNYAKYFRMLESGVPREEIKEMNGDHGPDLLVLSLDPERSLNDQMPSLPSHIQKRLQSNPALITSTSVDDDESEIVDLIYKSYLTQLHVFEHFLQEDEAGIKAMRESNGANESSSELTPAATDGSPKKKVKKLRLTKHFKRFVGVDAHKEHATDDEASEEENADLLEPSNSNHIEESTMAQYATGPVSLQPLPSAGLRRARRPTTASRRPRKPGMTKTPDRGVILAPKNAETPMSPLSTSPGHAGRKSFDPNTMDSIMSTSSADELLEANGTVDAALTSSATKELLEHPVVVKSFSSAPSDEDMGGLPTQTTPADEEQEKASPAPPLVIKSFPSAANTTSIDTSKKETEEASPPVMVIKTFPSKANEAPESSSEEEKKESAVPMVISSFPSAKRASNASKNKADEEEKKETAGPMVISSFPSAKRASNASNKKKDGIAIPKLDGDGKQVEKPQDEQPQDTEEEKKKKEELRKAVAAMHQFKLGSYDDSFGSIPTTVLPEFCPNTGEPSIHSHLSSISSHSSDASSSYESESESDSDEDDGDEDDGNEDGDQEKIEPSASEEESEKETIDMDEYIHLSDKLIDANAELFEAKYLLENSQKREEALLGANKAKDRKILRLSETIEEMQAHINVLSAQNAEAGKIMMELTASIEVHKRQKLFRRISIASSTGISMASFSSSVLDQDDTPASQHKRSSGGPLRRKSEDTLGSESRRSNSKRASGSGQMRRTSGSGHNRLSSFSASNRIGSINSLLGPATEEGGEGFGESSTPLMMSFTSGPATSSPNVREVPPSAASNVRQVPPKEAQNTSEPAAIENSVLEDNMFPPAANVREITPLNRRRVKEVSMEEGQKQIPATPIAPSSVPAPVPAPSQPLVIRSYQPSERLAERRRKKRELEERLKMSVAKSHSSDADDSHPISTE
ncbi:unnamed protein product [Cylindrotheca closterium]|uniref:Uncharacterized protein n=1 Tax=Cylindrotheca closterium TaxID=2856 RepID=A0AAD2CJH6_9STRA|nr:unnamed protein product [Cylindrotheca closterium]